MVVRVVVELVSVSSPSLHLTPASSLARVPKIERNSRCQPAWTQSVGTSSVLSEKLNKPGSSTTLGAGVGTSVGAADVGANVPPGGNGVGTAVGIIEGVAVVGSNVGAPLGDAVGITVVGIAVGVTVGDDVIYDAAVGGCVGLGVGAAVGVCVGLGVGASVGVAVGASVGVAVGPVATVGAFVGKGVGT